MLYRIAALKHMYVHTYTCTRTIILLLECDTVYLSHGFKLMYVYVYASILYLIYYHVQMLQ